MTTPLKDQIAEACKEPTLAKALAHIAVWEAERAIGQAFYLRDHPEEIGPDGQGWHTCFAFMFDKLIEAYNAKPATEA